MTWLRSCFYWLQFWLLFFSSTGVVYIPKAGMLPFCYSCLFFWAVFFSFLAFSDFSDFSVPCLACGLTFPWLWPYETAPVFRAFQVIYCRSPLLALMAVYSRGSVGLGLGCSGSWFLPWPLITFWQGYPRQVVSSYLHQSIIWLRAWDLHRNIGLRGLLMGHNQHQTPLILIEDVWAKLPNLGLLLIRTGSPF